MRRCGRVLGAWLSLALGLACTRQSGPPNLLLITLDTTRRDHLSVYGYQRATTPNLERFAAQGVRFDLAYSASSTTATSHATLFTGLHPLSHGVLKNALPLDPAHVTLATRLRERGYLTGGIVSSEMLAVRFGLAQGFDSWQDDFDPAHASILSIENGMREGFDRRADATTQRAIEWLERTRVPGRPFFLFVHYFDPHTPYDPPAEYAARFPPLDGHPEGLSGLIARYDAEIAFTDAQLGLLFAALDRLGLADDTLVVTTADHGEGLMQHGYPEHGVHIYEEQVRVPLLLRWPGHLPAGRVIGSAVGSIDVAPTLLELLGAAPDPDSGLQGQSLVPLLDGAKPPERAILLFRRHYAPGREGQIAVSGVKHGIRVGDWKYIVGPEEGTRELYDVAHDPRERENRIEAEPARAAELATRLDDWLARHAHPQPAPQALSPEERERLKALGYVE